MHIVHTPKFAISKASIHRPHVEEVRFFIAQPSNPRLQPGSNASNGRHAEHPFGGQAPHSPRGEGIVISGGVEMSSKPTMLRRSVPSAARPLTDIAGPPRSWMSARQWEGVEAAREWCWIESLRFESNKPTIEGWPAPSWRAISEQAAGPRSWPTAPPGRSDACRKFRPQAFRCLANPLSYVGGDPRESFHLAVTGPPRASPRRASRCPHRPFGGLPE